MTLIKLFVIGAIGYLFSGLYDVAIIHRKSLLKKFLYIGFFITAVPYAILLASYPTPHTLPLRWILYLLFIVFGALSAYSVLIEIAVAAKHADGGLYRGGTYAISRHPGFLWYTAITILAAMYFWNGPIALLCFALWVCDLLLITIEDLVLFPRMFEGYREYRRQVPFFVTPHSIKGWRTHHDQTHRDDR